MQDEIYERIFKEDEDHLYVDRDDGHYYLGLQQYMRRRNLLLLVNTVSAKVYLRHSHQDVVDYLEEYSMIRVNEPKLDIIKLHVLPDLSFSSVVKTYWIRLIQRHWRSALARRLSMWKSCRFQRRREVGLVRCTPVSIRGLMSMYRRD
jgi:hypothetical protein